MRALSLAQWLALPILLAAAGARAEDLRPFCADRPGKATPPCILDAGHLQLEVGLGDANFQNGAGVHEDTYGLAATELRYGLTRRLEAELDWTPLILDRRKGSPHETGVGDLTLGVRWSMSDPDGPGGVAISLQPFVTAPTATNGLGAGGWTGGVRVPMSAPLPAGFSLGFAPEADVARNAEGHGTHLTGSAAVSVGHAVGDAISIGAELWGQVDDDPAGRTKQASFDLTFARAVGKAGQVDAGANFGLNAHTPEVEVYVGVSRRF
jgi:hypothetical protein